MAAARNGRGSGRYPRATLLRRSDGFPLGRLVEKAFDVLGAVVVGQASLIQSADDVENGVLS